ncbi:MAG TPA: multicopper oxidase domain-containing protein, partial [Propionibacteriaceae bacterium]|nr:multicopper oxidase domain-containing protein [Propionibacteriaceae bacterium]
AGSVEFLSGLSTPTWSYTDGRYDVGYLGPTLRARRGERVRVMIENQLSEITTVHWHGMHLPARNDGGPHTPIAPGEQWQPQWSIDQPTATLWYHPHPHGQAEAQVTRGLAGLFYLDDSSNSDLPHRYGIDDIPIILQDRTFDSRGRFLLRGRAVTGLLGDTILVNGTYNPHLMITARRVRLRILNASTARIYHLAFADDREFSIIGTDCGLLPAPQPTRRLLLSPAERAEIVLDLRPGEQPVLRSLPWDLNLITPLTNGAGGNDHLDLLQLRTGSSLAMGVALPEQLETKPAVALANVAVRRDIQLDGREINGQQMDMSRIDAVVGAGTTELWTVQNTHNQPHNFHVHGVAFQIIPAGATAADPGLGWKDTVLLAAGETVQLAIVFPPYQDPLTPYMYHCHLMWHEDEGMMA